MEWMYWTPPTAIFFAVIAMILAGMTVWEVVSPTGMRRGFLPLETTRGDRLFIGLLTSAWFHLAWLGLSDFHPAYMTVACIGWLIVVLRWG